MVPVNGSVVDKVGAFLAERLPGTPQRASVTFLGVEPVDVLRFVAGDGDGQLVYVTVGCSRHPMTEPDDLHADPVRGPRAEVVVRMAAGSPLPGLHRRMATIAAAPAVEGLILTSSALIDLGEPLWDGSDCTAVLLDDDELGEFELGGELDPVRFLRAIPITANEAAWVRLKGADELRAAWDEAGIDVTVTPRKAASL